MPAGRIRPRLLDQRLVVPDADAIHPGQLRRKLAEPTVEQAVSLLAERAAKGGKTPKPVRAKKKPPVAANDSGETATAEWFKGVEPKLLKIGAVTLAPSTEAGKSSGLTFHYPPYAVGPYAEGEYVAFVPWGALKPYLAPEGARIFGGARPKGDDDGQP